MNTSAKYGAELKNGRKTVKLGYLVVLALMASMAIPARAADDRAVKQRVAPVYPEIAKRMKIVGEVKLEATVDATGKVTDVKSLSGAHVLAVAAEDAVRKWQFESGSGTSKVNLAFNFN